ncbi:hypothetical protein GCM10009609_43300 [Pseudonocardia aurantiaca]
MVWQGEMMVWQGDTSVLSRQPSDRPPEDGMSLDPGEMGCGDFLVRGGFGKPFAGEGVVGGLVPVMVDHDPSAGPGGIDTHRCAAMRAEVRLRSGGRRHGSSLAYIGTCVVGANNHLCSRPAGTAGYLLASI